MMMKGTYSIKDIERLTGIKAHTIRIWEVRYGILKPSRTETKIRVYDDQELKKILKVSYLNKMGYKISRLARLTEEELSGLIDNLQNEETQHSSHVDMLISAMMNLDEQMAFSVIENIIERDGFEECFENVLLPVLHKTGLLWQANTIEPAREHFIAHIIENILQQQIASITKPNQTTYRVVLLQLTNDFHEMSLLYILYLFRKHQIPLLYLGVSVPPEDIIALAAGRDDLMIYVHSVMNYNEVFEASMKKLIKNTGHNKIFVSGKAVSGLNGLGVSVINSVKHFKQLLSEGVFNGRKNQ